MKIYRISQFKPLNTKIEKYMYHGTFDENIYSIWKNGLQPSNKPHWGGELGETSRGKIFFCVNPKNTEFYTSIIMNSNYDATDLPEIMLLRVPTNKISNLQRGSAEDEFYTDVSVSPFDIDVLWGGHGWKPLKSIEESLVDGVSVGEWRENSIDFVDQDVDQDVDNKNI
jgi:hypothetical protein